MSVRLLMPPAASCSLLVRPLLDSGCLPEPGATSAAEWMVGRAAAGGKAYFFCVYRHSCWYRYCFGMAHPQQYACRCQCNM